MAITAYSPDGTFTTTAGPVVVPPPPTGGGGTGMTAAYGTCGSTGVGNFRLWGDGGALWDASYRWRAPFSKYLRTIRWYDVHDPGYGAGAFGPTEITLRNDVAGPSQLTGGGGTATHMFATAKLSQTEDHYGTGPVGSARELSTFQVPYQVTAGQLYHVVFHNSNPNYDANHISVDAMVNQRWEQHPVWGPGSIDMGCVHGPSVEAGVAHRTGYLPVMDLSFSDTPTGPITGHHGQGLLQLEQPQTISGNEQVRQRFTVSGGDKTVTSVLPYLERVSGSAQLVVYLEDSSGGIIDQVAFPASDFVVGSGARDERGSEPRWVERNFGQARTLADGTTYNLRFACAAGTEYMMEAYGKGNGFGYDPSLSFPDGGIQVTAGGATGAWSSIAGEVAQFFMRRA